MNQQLTENEIMKLLEQLNYPNQADIMQQKLFFIQTETIRQQKINDERIVEALMNIAGNNPSGSVRKEANKTLKSLGITPPPIDPKLATELSNKPGNFFRMGAVAGSVIAFLTIIIAQFFALGSFWFIGLLIIAIIGAILFGVPVGGIGGMILGGLLKHWVAAIIGGILAVGVISPVLFIFFSFCGFLGGC